jgi:4-hydroxy-tetrahydrodipicolinate synthase
MVTPFDADGGLDLDGAAGLARWLVEQGNDGLVLAGTTGESPTLSDEEKIALWRAVREAVDVPLMAGSTTNDTAHSVRLTEAATESGVDGILGLGPYYSRPSQAGMEAHFRAIAAATELPIVIYDIPVRTGRKIATATLLRLAHDVPNIAGLKDAAANPGETARLIAEAPDDFEVYSGDDSLTLPLLAVGAVGTIGVATHWTAGLQAEMIAAFAKGDVEHARSLNARLLPSFAYETSDTDPNPIPTKVMLARLGQPAGPCRLPLGPPSEGLADRADQVLAGLG